MHWDPEAEQLIEKAPALLRRFVRKRVEEFARAQGCDRVTAALVTQARRQSSAPGAEPDPEVVERLERELRTADRSARTYQVQVCAGAVGCPRALVPVAEIADALAVAIEASGFPQWLTEGRRGKPILSHHRLHVAVAGCPNACSQPQIQDAGIIGRAAPVITPERCTRCEQCLAACHERAIALTDEGPVIDPSRCIGCGDCSRVCASSALDLDEAGCRVLVGGKLGRHPRLATECLARASQEEVLAAFRRVVAVVMDCAEAGERVGALLDRGACTEDQLRP